MITAVELQTWVLTVQTASLVAAGVLLQQCQSFLTVNSFCLAPRIVLLDYLPPYGMLRTMQRYAYICLLLLLVFFEYFVYVFNVFFKTESLQGWNDVFTGNRLFVFLFTNVVGFRGDQMNKLYKSQNAQWSETEPLWQGPIGLPTHPSMSRSRVSLAQTRSEGIISLISFCTVAVLRSSV